MIEHKYSISLVSQGDHRFYTLTIPSEVLAKTCFVSTRDDNPTDGFQRLLDEKRAQSIADYIDNGMGTIPTAIVLSAQNEAELEIISKGKTVKFKEHPKAFLVLDGQHRVYGFSKAKSSVRVPVVIYNGLNRRDESRIFIDINTQQKPVPNELLFDIKNLAEYETDLEQQLREIFDLFHSDSQSSLLGLTSPAKKSRIKISRVTFNSSFKPITKNFGNKDAYEIYEICNSYISSFIKGMRVHDIEGSITNSTVFRAIIAIFPHVAQRTKDRYSNYTQDAFSEILSPLFSKIKVTKITSPGSSYKDLAGYLIECMKTDFTL
ncbi:DGQHR domain-containing protein [Aquimarina megaterium]|uniref:DGQHR domain-containing protein n=1 Tax=Aquimarina megaterium TaxID=1443666 RepID=UPI000942BC64|nr:DGQHR domain-containing protein [Aquimarina megaterium]